MALDEDILATLMGFMQEDRETFVPARLSILVYLFFTQRTQFTHLQKALKLTSGNLSSHLRKLQQQGLVTLFKHFVELKPTTIVAITPEGIQRIRTQIQHMRDLVSAVINQDPSPTSNP